MTKQKPLALNRLTLFAPISRIDEEQRMVFGVATTEAAIQDFPEVQVILDYEATKRAATRWAKWGNVREMHQLSAVGVARVINLRDATRDLEVGTYIEDDQAWRKVKSETYKGYSLGAEPSEWRKEGNNVIRVTEYDIVELSLVDRPKDPAAVFSMWRAEDREWKANGASNLPLADEDRAWDADAAEGRVRAWATEDDEVDWTKYRKAFFVYDAANKENFGAYKLPFADVIDDELMAVPHGLFAVASVLQGGMGGADIPESVRDAVMKKCAAYYHKMDRKAPWEEDTTRVTGGRMKIRRADSVWLAGGDPYLLMAGMDVPWDDAAAIERLQERATEGERVNWVEYGRGFLMRDAGNPEAFESYRLPFADVAGSGVSAPEMYIADGELIAVPAAVFAAVAAFDAMTDLPETTRESLRKRFEMLYNRMGRRAPWEELQYVRKGGKMSEVLLRVWSMVLGDAAVPESADEALKLLRSKLSPAGTVEPPAPASDAVGDVTLQRVSGVLDNVLQQLKSLEGRMTKIEQAPAALPVNRTGDPAPSLDAQIATLERTIKAQRLPPDSDEVRELSRLYEQKRRSTPAK